MVALGSGCITGVGLGDGRQKLGFIPEHHTDFIFSVIGEELGLIATIGVVLGFASRANRLRQIGCKPNQRVCLKPPPI